MIRRIKSDNSDYDLYKITDEENYYKTQSYILYIGAINLNTSRLCTIGYYCNDGTIISI